MNPIKHTLTLFSSLFLTPLAALHAAGPPYLLLLEALQYENIGDSGRVPGTLRQLDQYLPGATVTLLLWQLHEREREMLSLQYLKSQRLSTPVIEFGLADTFGIDMRDEHHAKASLKRIGVVEGKFICSRNTFLSHNKSQNGCIWRIMTTPL